MTIPMRFYTVFMPSIVFFCKLFFVFTMQETFLIASGLGYRARTEKQPENFNSIRCAEIIKVVTASDSAVFAAKWNMRTSHWLKYYVMIPLIDRSKPKGSSHLMPVFATFMVSAIWHGLYFGYFGCFINLALCDIMFKTFGATALAHSLGALLPSFVTRTAKWFALQYIIS